MEIFHVYPVNDIDEHDVEHGLDDKPCKCNPRIEQEGENYIVVHNAFDGREVFEQGEELLKNKN